MKIGNIDNIQFQKKLMARCAVKNDKRKKFCNIYALEPEKRKDRHYFRTLSMSNDDWKDARFLDALDRQASEYKLNQKTFYVLEDLDKNCLGVCSIDKTDKDKDTLSYFEVVPKNAYRNKDRKIKYVGETMLAFLTKMAKKSGKKYLEVPYVMSDAIDFYIEKCNFEKMLYPNTAIASSSSFEALEKQNKKHTRSKICILG